MKFYNFLLFFLVISCTRKVVINDENFKPNNSSEVNVIINKIDRSTFRKQLKTNGKIGAFNKIELLFNTNERLSTINVTNGQKIIKGEIIASLENSLLKNNIKKAEIEYKKTQNKFEEEKINFSDNISNSNIENLKIKSGLLEAQNNLERTQIEYNQTLLKAPFSGVIANLKKKEGDYISSSDVFCTLINPNNLEVSFSILENEFQFVSIGQEIEIQSFFDKDQLLKGIITEINPLVDKNGLIQIKAKVLSKETSLLDGMNVKVLINKFLKDVIVIPKEALVLRSNREVVFTIENGFAKWNYVEVVGENNNSYAIKKGLKISDTLIISGNLNLSHDAKVKATFNKKR